MCCNVPLSKSSLTANTNHKWMYSEKNKHFGKKKYFLTIILHFNRWISEEMTSRVQCVAYFAICSASEASVFRFSVCDAQIGIK